MLSPKHVTDCVKTLLKKREERKRFYLVSMLVMMLTHMMAGQAEQYCQFLFTKRQFQWELDTYSYYTTMDTVVASLGMMVLSPIFHHFNINDNMIVLVSSLSMISAQLIRAFAKTETVFFASVAAGFGGAMFSAPIRAQMTRCVPPEENGKVGRGRKYISRCESSSSDKLDVFMCRRDRHAQI